MPGQTDALTALLSDPTYTEEEKQKLIAAMGNMDTTMMQDYLAALGQMSPDERTVAIDALSTPYEEERSDLRDELSQNYDMFTAESPQGQMAGNNQFSVYVGASPLEHIASGVGKYMGGKGMKENREELEALNKKKQSATAGMQNARIDAIQAKALSDALKSGKPLQSPGPEPEDWLEKWRRGL